MLQAERFMTLALLTLYEVSQSSQLWQGAVGNAREALGLKKADGTSQYLRFRAAECRLEFDTMPMQRLLLPTYYVWGPAASMARHDVAEVTDHFQRQQHLITYLAGLVCPRYGSEHLDSNSEPVAEHAYFVSERMLFRGQELLALLIADQHPYGTLETSAENGCVRVTLPYECCTDSGARCAQAPPLAVRTLSGTDGRGASRRDERAPPTRTEGSSSGCLTPGRDCPSDECQTRRADRHTADAIPPTPVITSSSSHDHLLLSPWALVTFAGHPGRATSRGWNYSRQGHAIDGSVG
ncbi:hypothetical protein B0J13DRAFT_519385 [Dactylonectria estremocensis]|uniref:Uncharacterized protein n=1 Tax=Dactylonectria estremocensis TaxID=1079267 RepID=A0A9P9JAY5_9HYPO|nr:hypothetical protein B0J13DRAFT_519385 [Dactylonectria estremocensis]